ncbi:MAG: preprotein translocase subunit SecG [Clostridia bacterium]|nr:preprotein translocase subunit SecG [Clostridia bacterium]
MAVIELILEILIIVLSLIIIVAVALQKSKSEGITGVTATSESENYFGKGKELGNEEKLAKITRICIVAFVVISIILTILFAMDAAAKPDTETTTSAIESISAML